jgi:phenylacetate-coenzyme A ligase PaaK-like adenylate-forming protein
VAESCHVDFLPFKAEHGGPEVGRILVTTFDNPWRSLVRFDIGDVVRLNGSAPCPCGRSEGLTLMSVEGRTVSLTRTPDGSAVTQGAVDRVISAAAGLGEYQFLQTGSSEYHLRFVAEDVEPRRVAGEAVDALRRLYGPAASITVEPVEAIAPDPPGKYSLAKAIELIEPNALLDETYAPRRF